MVGLEVVDNANQVRLAGIYTFDEVLCIRITKISLFAFEVLLITIISCLYFHAGINLGMYLFCIYPVLLVVQVKLCSLFDLGVGTDESHC